MKRIAISDMTPEQAADELAMMDIKKLIRKARQAEQKAAEATSAVFRALNDLCIDLDVPSKAENADNLADAVSCYIQYGEFGLRELMAEIKAKYKEQ